MKPIILITSCSYRLKQNDECRETWLREWGKQIAYKFVFGSGHAPADDEITFDVRDDYAGLPAKIQASHKWAVQAGYDQILKADADCYYHIPRLLSSGFWNYGYSGNFFFGPDFAMGAAYWLDKISSEILVKAPLPYPGSDGGDDVWVGQVMRDAGIVGHHEPRYYIGQNPNFDEVISLHTTDLPWSMAEIHRRMLDTAVH